MARKKTGAPKQVEPEEESQEVEDLESTQPGEDDTPRRRRAANGSISKAEAVRQALAAGKGSPEDGVAYIKRRFGIDIAKPHFSATKSQIKKRERGAEEPAPKRRGGRAGQEEALDVSPETRSAGNGPDLLAAMEAMKPLVEALGADKVKRIVDLLG